MRAGSRPTSAALPISSILADLIPEHTFIHGIRPTSVEHRILYRFIANLSIFSTLSTPLGPGFVSARPISYVTA